MIQTQTEGGVLHYHGVVVGGAMAGQSPGAFVLYLKKKWAD